MQVVEAVQRGLTFIEDHLEEEITILDVARAAGYSQFHYSRVFSKLLRCSIYDYIIKRKLSEACKVLLSEDIKVVDVAYQFAFKSHESFSRAFKKFFGVPPSQISRNALKGLYEKPAPRYLSYLESLSVEKNESLLEGAYFLGVPYIEDQSVKEDENYQTLLCALAPEICPIQIRYIMTGDLYARPPVDLHYRLDDMMGIGTIKTGGLKHMLRFIKEVILLDRGYLGTCFLLKIIGDRTEIYIIKST
jgi:AraC-like DNA-binding protein